MSVTQKIALRVYALVVCFTSLAVLVYSLGCGVYAAIGIVSPETTMSRWAHSNYESNQEFLENWRNSHKDDPVPSDAEVTALRSAAHRHAVRVERADRSQLLLGYGISIVLSGCVFLIHWRIAKRNNADGSVA